MAYVGAKNFSPLQKNIMKHKILISILIISTLLVSGMTKNALCLSKEDSKEEWKEYKSSHFVIEYHPEIPDKYIREFGRKCEKHYRILTDKLGFSRFDFWLWENRTRIFVYNTREEYLTGTGNEAWSEAAVHVKKRIINTFYFDSDFFDVILPHELSHIILREFIGTETKVPLWFDEGVACANEKDSRKRYFGVTKRLLDSGRYIDVGYLGLLTWKRVERPEVFYPTSAVMVMFLLEGSSGGKQSFVVLCNELKSGKSFYEAMDRVYKIKGPKELNEKIINYLKTSK